MGQPRQKFTTRGAPSPSTHTTAKITVFNGANELEGAEVEIKGAGRPGKGKTDASGVFKTGTIRAGDFDIVVKAEHLGPPQPPGTVVTQGPLVKKIKLLPNTALPRSKPTNEITIVLQQENPRIHIKVIEDRGILGSVPLAGASIEIIGLTTGTSDAAGRFTSPFAPFGSHNVLVKKPGLFPQNQDGSAFFRGVELRELGTVGVKKGPATPAGTPLSRDLQLTVILGARPPTHIPPFVPNPVAVWASGSHTPHTVDEDPRLSKDTPAGQSGWDMGLNYASFFDLAVKLQRAKPLHLGGGDIQSHQVSRLAIVAHGAPGVVDVDQKENGDFGIPTPQGSQSLTAARMGAYTTELDRIGEALRQNSVVYLASCQAADGAEGEDLLKALSRRWPTTTVVGIRTLATTVAGMFKPAKPPPATMFAGVRDTRFANGLKKPGEVRDYEQTSVINDLSKLPWLSENSPHATMARDGNIIRLGDPVPPFQSRVTP